MNFLEHKIPPPVLAFLIGFLMWATSKVTIVLALPTALRWSGALLIALVGAAVSLTAVFQFRRAKTTVNPLKPTNASSLVTSGIFGYSRNPMYLAFLLNLIACAVFLAAPVSLLGPVLFYFYINRFQIAPEERALTQIFGAEFVAYVGKVRRWV